MADWAFLEPWRRLLRQLVRFEDHEELVVGTLHEQMRCIRLDLFHYCDLSEPGEFDFGADEEEVWRERFLTTLREALELIGLALHYDKRVWRWLRPEYGLPTFNYSDASVLEPLFQFAFHDTWWSGSGDHQDEVSDGLAVILQTDTTTLSDDYSAAKLLLQDRVGARYDPSYRIPVSVELAPRRVSEEEHNEWCAAIQEFVWATRAPIFKASSCYELVSITLHGWRLRVDESLVSLLSELLLAQVEIPELSLRLMDAHAVVTGKVCNEIFARRNVSGQLVETVGIHEPTPQRFRQVCTSLAEARTAPRRLFLYEAFGENPLERAFKWGCLRYALAGSDVGSATLIKHLRIEDTSLSALDLRHLIGDFKYPPDGEMSPQFSDRDERRVLLSPDACLFVDDEYWHTLDALGLTHDQSFVVYSDAVHDERMSVLVPGFGVCQVKCDAVVDAFEVPASSKTTFALSSLHCGINNCEPETIELLCTTFGSTLTRLKLCLGNEIRLSKHDANEFLNCLPMLEFLDLNHLSMGSMDPFVAAYESGRCKIAVLSLMNSFVEPTSMTRFVVRLQDPSKRIAQCLREFRFIFEDPLPPPSDTCPTIIAEEAARALHDVFRRNTVLTFIDIGLTYAVYEKHFDTLTAFDTSLINEHHSVSKLAFLSVLQARPSSCEMKRQRNAGVRIPRRRRRAVVTRIWGFLQPGVRRVVSVISVPRR